MANGDSQQELEFLFGDKDLHTARLASQEASRAAHWHSYFSDFGIFSPPSSLPSLPLLLPTEDFMAFQAAAVATLSIRGLLR